MEQRSRMRVFWMPEHFATLAVIDDGSVDEIVKQLQGCGHLSLTARADGFRLERDGGKVYVINAKHNSVSFMLIPNTGYTATHDNGRHHA